MLGILIGTACLFGLIKVLRWGRRGHHHGYGHGGGCGSGYGGGCGSGYGGGWGGGEWGGRGGYWRGGGWGGEGFFLRALFDRLEATPDQQKVIASAIDEVRETARKLRGEVAGSRGDVAKAVRSESFDAELFGEMFSRHDAALETMRKAVVGAIAKVHVVLDDKQRARLADLIERGPGYFRGAPPWASAHA